MKSIFAAAALVALSSSAFAADAVNVEPAPAPLPMASTYNWSGAYVGVQAGYAWGRVSGPFQDASQTGSGPYSFDMNGGLVGGYAGYNWQYNAYVFGIEGDVNAAFGNKSTDHNVLWNGTTLYDIAGKQTWTADVRGRVGYAFDRFLPYISGGVAFGNVDTSYAFAGGTPFLTKSSSRVGWTVGFGLEYAFTDNIIGRIDYRYTDLGSKSFTDTAENTYDNPEFHSNSVLAGIRYKF